ncbi:unnamed protein product [Linum tenue]|uniref:Uncharacterized protein n=1 Tax=Linum tenue TaxID=586396 RepID=A0AAV0L9S3_9ROSI|nr:unnamed protein product [Linum tenue]CAI0430214.1 unnamed protein product [Linum tenue]
MKLSSSPAILSALLLIFLIHGNEVAALQHWGSNSDLCKFTSFPQRFLRLRNGVCTNLACNTACNNMFAIFGVNIVGRCEHQSCACYEGCLHPLDPPKSFRQAGTARISDPTLN